MLLATLAGTVMLGVAPMAQPLLAVGLFGLGAGGMATLLLVLSVDLTDSRSASASLNAMTMLVGYAVGAAGPFLLGAARDVTGSLGPGYLVVSGLVVVSLVIVSVFRPGLKVARAD
jgi:CP family cyanate transporter-like MFS transporter